MNKKAKLYFTSPGTKTSNWPEMIFELFRVICFPKWLHTFVVLYSLTLHTLSLGFTTVGDRMSYRLVSCPGSSSSCIQTSPIASLYQLYNNYCICLFVSLLSNVSPNPNECLTRSSGTQSIMFIVFIQVQLVAQLEPTFLESHVVFSTHSRISGTLWKQCPYTYDFMLGNEKKSQKVKASQ